MATSFKRQIETTLCRALGLSKARRAELYNVPNMDRLVSMTDQNLQKLHEIYTKTSENTMASAVALAPVMRLRGHQLDGEFDDFVRRSQELVLSEPPQDLGDVGDVG